MKKIKLFKSSDEQIEGLRSHDQSANVKNQGVQQKGRRNTLIARYPSKDFNKDLQDIAFSKVTTNNQQKYILEVENPLIEE